MLFTKIISSYCGVLCPFNFMSISLRKHPVASPAKLNDDLPPKSASYVYLIFLQNTFTQRHEIWLPVLPLNQQIDIPHKYILFLLYENDKRA
jgi:hypothetical protein